MRTSRAHQVEKVKTRKASNKVPRKASKSPTSCLNSEVKSSKMFATEGEYQEAAILALRSLVFHRDFAKQGCSEDSSSSPTDATKVMSGLV